MPGAVRRKTCRPVTRGRGRTLFLAAHRKPAEGLNMIDDLIAAPARLSVSAVHRSGGVRLVVAGEVDVVSAGRFREYLSGALDLRPTSLTVDLSGVPFLDSTGLSALVYAHQRARAEGVTLVVADPRPQVHRLLDVTGLLPVLTGEG
jgi:anti-anti-sigma factor